MRRKAIPKVRVSFYSELLRLSANIHTILAKPIRDPKS